MLLNLIGWVVVLVLCTVHLPAAGVLAVGLLYWAAEQGGQDGR